MAFLNPEWISVLCRLLELYSAVHIQLNGEFHAEFLTHCSVSYLLDNGLHFKVPNKPEGAVLILGPANRTFLEMLQEVRYPWIGVWCVVVCMMDPSENIERLCDSFLLEKSVDDVHVLKETRCIVAFTLQPPGNVCNKVGIHNVNTTKSKLSGQTLLVAWGSTDLYTTPRKSANEVSQHAVGFVEGFERALLKLLSRSLNFSVVWKAEYDLPFGIRPLEPTVWGRTIMKTLLEREVHLIFGDFSLLHPRELFCDFTYTHDADSASFMSLVRVRPLNLWSIIQLAGYWTLTLYLVLSAMVGCLSYLKRTSSNGKKGVSARSSHILFAVFLIFCQQQKDPRVGRLWLVLVHRICVFFLGSTFSSSLVNSIANPGLEGKYDDMSDILDAAFQRNAHLISNINFANNLKNSADNPRLNKIATRIEVCGSIQNCSDRLFAGIGSAFLLGEGLHHAREIWSRNVEDIAHISRENFYDLYQSFGLQKGCVFQRKLTRKIHRAMDAGLLVKFKANAGLQLINKVVLTPVQQPIRLSAIRELFGGICTGQGLAVLILISEMITHRWTVINRALGVWFNDFHPFYRQDLGPSEHGIQTSVNGAVSPTRLRQSIRRRTNSRAASSIKSLFR